MFIKMENIWKRYLPWFLFAGVLFLYAWNLGFLDLGGDAAKYALNIAYPHPPLIRSMMWGMQVLFGFTPFFARLPLAILGAATVGFAFVLFRRLGLSMIAATVFTLAFGLNAEWIRWIRYGFLSASLVFFWTIAFLGLMRIEKDPHDSRGHWLLFAGFVGGCWSQLQGALFLPIYVLIYARLWFQFRRDGEMKKLFWIGALGIAQAALFFLYIATSPLILADIASFAKSSPKGFEIVHPFLASGYQIFIGTAFVFWAAAFFIRRTRLSLTERISFFLTLIVSLFLFKNPAEYYAPYAVFMLFLSAAVMLVRIRKDVALCLATLFLALSLSGTGSAFFVMPEQTVFNRHAADLRGLIQGEKEIIVLGPDSYQAQYYLPVVNRKLPGDLSIRNRIRFALIVNREGMTEEERNYAATLHLVARFERLELLERP